MLCPGYEDDTSRTILHVDIDCFYAQVEAILDPALATLPLGIRQKNIVITTNYVARQRGVPKSLYVHQVKDVCPDLVLVCGEDLSNYRKFSSDVFKLLSDYVKPYHCPVEKLGMDENFIDVSRMVEERRKSCKRRPDVVGHLYGTEETFDGEDDGAEMNLAIGSEIAGEIRAVLKDKMGLTSSCGIGHNKLVAKLVGSKHKPDQQTTIHPRMCSELLLSLPSAKSIPGVGSSTFKLLESKGLTTVQSIQEASMDHLNMILESSVAEKVKQFSYGIDPSIVKMSGLAQSIGLEDRFKGIFKPKECEEKLDWLLSRLEKLIQEDGRTPSVLKVSARDVQQDKGKWHRVSRQCKINPSLFNALKSSDQLDSPSRKTILSTCMSLLGKMVQMQNTFHLTMLSVSVSNFNSISKSGIDKYFGNSGQNKLSDSQEKSPHGEKSEPVGEFSILSKNLCNRFSEESTSSPNHLKRSGSANLPNGWDAEVFQSLPPELQQELLAGSQAQSSPVAKKQKTSTSILNYFNKA